MKCGTSLKKPGAPINYPGNNFMMILKEKHDLSQMLAEIEDDINEQERDVSQEKNIPQETITELMINNLKQKQKDRG